MTSLSAALEARDEPTYDDASQTLLDALDWIAKALPWLRGVKAGMDGLKHKPDDYTALCDLITQAEGKEVGNEWAVFFQ